MAGVCQRKAKYDAEFAVTFSQRFCAGRLTTLPPAPRCSQGNGQSESKMKNLPVPVFLRPVDEKEASMKVFVFLLLKDNSNTTVVKKKKCSVFHYPS